MFIVRERMRKSIDSSPAPAGALRRARWLLLGGALLLASCSAGLRVGYNNADTALAWTLNRYLDLDETQQALVKARSAKFLAWHRGSQLRDYAALLAQARTAVEREVTPAEVLALNQELNERLARLGEAAAPDLAELALTLRPAQIERLRDKLADSNQEWRREAKVDGPGFREARLRRTVDRAESWLGSVSRAQKELLRALLAERPNDALTWSEEGARRNAEFIALLERIARERPALAEATTWMRGFFAELARPPDAARRAFVQQAREANAELIARLLNSASPSQRAHLVRKLAGYEEDATLLAAGAANGRS
ncbi:MAG TPA: DUF6279 family lipoprotein [Burkholderiaceae bacterium]|nr:DUF6279 family lipoprotein [Burkholderiaceae bacterium]